MGIPMQDKINAAVRYMEHVAKKQGRDWISPTEIGREIGGPGCHSSYGSPICKAATSKGIMIRNERGHYKLSKETTNE